MSESNDPIAVLLPSYLGLVSEFLGLASALAAYPPGRLPGRVLGFARPPRGPAGHNDPEWDELARRLAARPDVELRAEERTQGGLLATIREEHVQLLMVDWQSWTAGFDHHAPRRDTHWLAQELPCDVAIVKWGGAQAIRQILLPVRGGPQGILTLRLAMALAERHDAMITLLHVEQPGLLPDDDAAVRAQLDALLARGAHPTRAQSAIVVAGSVEAAIAVEAEAHQVTIMGASPGDPGTPLLLGPVAEAVAARVTGTLIIVKAQE